MNFEDTPLYRIALDIQKTPNPVHYSWTVIIHAGGQDLPVLKLLNHDVNMDFIDNFTDEIMVEVVMKPSDFLKFVYPNQEAIELTVIKTPVGEVGNTPISDDVQILSERYMGTYIDRGNPVVQNTTKFANNPAAMDLSDMVNVEFQLIDKVVAKMRLLPVGGVYRQIKTDDAIRLILTQYSQLVKTDNDRKPLGVDIVKGNNQTPREQIVIPQRLMLTEVPKYIHEKCGGVYSAGFNYYYHNDIWYVYPCYDVKRQNQAGLKLTIINVPKNRFPSTERTYSLTGDNLTVLATGEVSFKDQSNTRRANMGNGVRFADANKVMDGDMRQAKDNRVYLSRGANNTEIMASRNESDMNTTLVSKEAITANPYVEYSNLAAREGSLFQMVWENAQSRLIYPGTPVTVYYIDNDNIKELHGIVLKAAEITQNRGVGLMENRYTTSVVLMIYVNRTLENDPI